MPVDGYQSVGINDSYFLHLGSHNDILMSHSITGTLRPKKIKSSPFGCAISWPTVVCAMI